MASTQALSLAETAPVLQANFRDMGRMVLGSLALYLHASGGLTHRRLCELSSDGGWLSAGRASAILLRLRMIGYVKAASLRSDGSARLYTPTEKMIAGFRNRVRIELRALAQIEPQAHEMIAAFHDARNFFTFYRILGERLVFAGQNARPDLKPFEELTTRDAGMLMIYGLLEAADTGKEFPPNGAAKISLSDFARRFGVSRTHVLRFLRDAEKKDFIRRSESSDIFTITTKLRDMYATYFAVLQIALATMAHRALLELKAAQALTA